MIFDYKYYIIGGVVGFCLIDIILKKFKLEGRYYMNHCINNGIVIYNTFGYMINSYNINNINININNISSNNYIHNLYITKSIIYSIHLYHILWYYKSLRYDDWMHHILMLGIALPLTEYVPQNITIGHCLFFLTGLPGFIDYFLLFLNRNNLLYKHTEKRINRWLNLWIRCPGCIMNATFIIQNIVINYNHLSTSEFMACLIILSTIYWNGIYFMAQIVTDYSNYQYKNNNNSITVYVNN